MLHLGFEPGAAGFNHKAMVAIKTLLETCCNLF